MKKKKFNLQRDFTFLTFSMFLVVFLWIISNIYDIYVKSTIDKTLQIQITPISNSFDLVTLENLKNRAVIQPNYIEEYSSEEAEIALTKPPVRPTPSTELEAPSTIPTINIVEPTETQPIATPSTILESEFTP